MPQNQPPDSNPREPVHNVPSPEALQVLNLRRHLAIIRERWLLAATIAILACSAVGYFLLSQPPVYESSAILVVDRAADRVVDVPEVVETGLGRDWSHADQTNVLLQTHIGEMSNMRFIRDLLDRYSAEEISSIIAPYEVASSSWELRHILASFRGGEPEDRSQKEVAAELIAGNLRVRRVPETLMLEVRFLHRDRELAAAVANDLVQLYTQETMDRRLDSHTRATAFLREQAEELRADVEQLEREAQRYREEHNLVSVEENQNIVAAQMSDVSAALTEARLRRVSAESTLEKVEELVDVGTDPREMATFPGFAFLQEAGDRLDALRNERERLSERYLENHPQMRENQQATEVLAETIRANVIKALNDLRNQHATFVAQERELRRELAEAERRSLELDQHAVDYQLIQRRAESARASYSQVLDRLQETSLAAQIHSTNLRFAQAATPPRRPASPQLTRVVLIVGFLGGIIFVGLPIGLNAMDRRLRNAGDVETLLRRPLLGEVPKIRKLCTRAKARLIDQDEEENPGFEAFRAIYSYLSMNAIGPGEGRSCCVMALVGSLPGEGKTFTAANLASTFAAHGKRTLLIDCDLRGPSMASVLGLQSPIGLESYLQEDSEEMEEAYPEFAHLSGKLHLLTANDPVRNATELMEGERFARLIAHCREEFELILLDTPPLKVFPDALSIVKHVDEVVYLCEFSRVEIGILRELIHRVERVHRKLVSGVIINRMPTGRNSRYCYSLNGYYGAPEYCKDYYGNRMEELCLRQRVGEWPVLRSAHSSKPNPGARKEAV